MYSQTKRLPSALDSKHWAYGAGLLHTERMVTHAVRHFAPSHDTTHSEAVVFPCLITRYWSNPCLSNPVLV
jgi:hypothetical protein